MRTAIAVTALAMLVACSWDSSPPAVPLRHYDFRGIHLGDSISSDVAATHRMECDADGCLIAKDTLADVEASTFLASLDGRVMSVVVTFPSESFATMEKLVAAKWGEPSSVKTDTLAHRPRLKASWPMAEGTLNLSSWGYLIIGSDSLTSIKRARDSLRIKDAAKRAM